MQTHTQPCYPHISGRQTTQTHAHSRVIPSDLRSPIYTNTHTHTSLSSTDLRSPIYTITHTHILIIHRSQIRSPIYTNTHTHTSLSSTDLRSPIYTITHTHPYHPQVSDGQSIQSHAYSHVILQIANLYKHTHKHPYHPQISDLQSIQSHTHILIIHRSQVTNDTITHKQSCYPADRQSIQTHTQTSLSSTDLRSPIYTITHIQSCYPADRQSVRLGRTERSPLIFFFCLFVFLLSKSIFVVLASDCFVRLLPGPQINNIP